MRISISVAVLILAFTAAMPANAQIVQIGPGGSVNVRAPFVRVYVGPNGETYVRAPFTEVVTPGYGYPAPQGYVIPQSQFFEPHIIEPAIEPAELAEPNQVTEMNWQQLKSYLRSAAAQLEQDLDGELSGWKKTFLPGTILDLVPEDGDDPLDEEAVEQLRPILAAFNQAAEQRDLQKITSLVSFQDVRQSLAELMLPPQERLHHQLIASSRRLQRDLNRVVNGESLKAYLSLPAGVDEDSPDGQPAAEELARVISNYEALNRTSQFRAVARLTSFQATRRHLADYQRSLATESRADASLEELELPPPKKNE